MLEEGLECGAHSTLMRYVEPLELSKGAVVGFDPFMGWFEIESCHVALNPDFIGVRDCRCCPVVSPVAESDRIGVRSVR